MTIAICIGTYGTSDWATLAYDRAIPSAYCQTTPATQVIHCHADTLQHARNGAAARADTDWLCFLDADDELDPNYIAAMTMALRDSDALLQPATLGIHPNGLEDRQPVVIPRTSLLDSNFMVIGTLIRRSQFERLGGFGDWPVYEDWDLWIRAWFEDADLIPVPGAIYRVHLNQGGRNSGDRETQLRVYHDIRTRYLRARR